MNETTKVKINLKEGLVELEGSEEFVQKNLNEFKQLLNRPVTQFSQQSNPNLPESQKTNNQTSKSSSKPKGVNVAPIPIDLKKNTPTLKELFNEKISESTNNQEIVALFVYYLNKKVNVQDVFPGHIVSCYNEIQKPKPLNIPQLFRDITHYKGWIEPAKEVGSVKITISGENLVEHDLPKKQDVKPSQNTAKK